LKEKGDVTMRFKIYALLYLLFFVSIITLYSPIVETTDSTTLAVDPQSSTPTVGETFNVNITVNNIANFTCWELKIYYLKGKLNCTGTVEGPFLKTGGSTYFNKTINNNYNTTHGSILAYSTLLGPNSVNGSGVILTVTFKALSGGSTPLKLSDTKLGDEKIPPQPIPHTTIDGTVLVVGGVHDIAITEVTPMKTIVGQGYFVNVKVALTNQGEYTEVVNVTLYANTTYVGSQNVTLINGGNAIVITAWDTTSFAKGNYTLWAYAWPVPEETDTADNTFVYGWVFVSLPGDVMPEFRVVDIYDVTVICAAYDAERGIDGGYWHDPACDRCPHSPNLDINDDGIIDIYDVVICTSRYEQTW
jgi:hypothetical protein